MKKLFLLIFLLFFISFGFSSKILLVKINNEITFSTRNIIKEAISFAEKNNFDFILITLDTPGGNSDATLDLVKIIDRSNVPIICFVYPDGSTAWSAGTFILLSCHIAAMTNHSLIGSAQPLLISESGFKTINESKIINALVAFLEERAKMYGRNDSIIKSFIVENINLNGLEAKKLNVIDFLASDIDDLLKQLDGVKVKGKILDTKNYTIEEFKGIRFDLLNVFSNRIVSSIILIIGIYALIFGLSNPGYFAELVGASLILLGLIGLGFEVNTISLILIIVGAALVIYEVFSAATLGVFGILGIILVTIGSILISPLSFEYIFPISIFASISSIFFFFIMIAILRARRKRPFQEIIGKRGVAVEKISKNKVGYVKIEGELWRAVSEKTIRKNKKIVVVGKRDSLLIVEEAS